MKKFSLFASFLLLLGMTSCADEDDLFGQSVNGKVFTGILDDASHSRTNITKVGNTGKISWVAGDAVFINDIEFEAHPNSENNTLATFTKKFQDDPDPDPIGGTYTAKFGNFLIQDAFNGSNCMAPMTAVSNTRELHFANDGAILKLNVFTNDELHHVIRRVHVNNYALSLGDDGVDISTAKDFYIAVPAGTYEHVKITFVTDNGWVCVLRSGNKTYTRNKVYNYTISQALVFQEPFETTYYTKSGPAVPNVPTQFTADERTSANQGAFKLEFSEALGNSINWAEGDTLEVKMNFVDGQDAGNDLLVMGNTEAWGNRGYCVKAMASQFPASWIGIRGILNVGSTQFVSLNTAGKGMTPGILYVRLHRGGMEYSNDGTTWIDSRTQTAAGNLATYDACYNELMSLGIIKPFYFGNYGNNCRGMVYDYLKITRNLLPDFIVPVRRIILSPSAQTIQLEGSGTQLDYTIMPADATYQSVTWTSSNENVATVTNTGRIIPRGVGSTNITVTANDGSGAYGTAVITVIDDDEDEEITGNVIYYSKKGYKHNAPQSFSIFTGQSYQFSIADINWSGGDELEVKITKGDRAVCEALIVIGSSTAFNENPNVQIVTTAAGAKYGYYNIKQYFSGLPNLGGTDSPQAYLKINGYGIFHSTDGTNWTPCENAHLEELLVLNPLIIGTRADKQNDGTIEYIKLTKANSAQSTTLEGTAAGSINSTTTTW